MAHVYTKEQAEFIKNNVVGRSSEELKKMFNAEFDLKIGVNQIISYKKNHKLTSGLTGRYEKGNVPFNKGKKKYWVGGEETQFKKGHMPHNWVPIGTERTTDDGYVQIKIQEGKFQRNWKAKHTIIWEATNGPVPKGHVIIFADGNRQNFEQDNLIMVSRRALIILNKNGLIKNDKELTNTGLIVADVYLKIADLKKK